MIKEQFEKIQALQKQFAYSSLMHTKFEQVSDYDACCIDENAILLYGYNNENKTNEYHWACNDIESLLEVVGNKKHEDAIISFVPKEWVERLGELGFKIYAVWNDYFAEELEVFACSSEREVLGIAECEVASNVTLSCRNQSRGFSGQSTEWIGQWLNNSEPAAPTYVYDCTILVQREKGEIAGIICIGVYDSSISKTLWVREVAVHPKFQRKGIARKLIGQAFAYGIEHGATRAFLMADECNKYAIHLYQAMGFSADKDEVEINMIR